MAPKVFPAVCLSLTLLLYIAGYHGLSSIGRKPPPTAEAGVTLPSAAGGTPAAQSVPAALDVAAGSASASDQPLSSVAAPTSMAIAGSPSGNAATAPSSNKLNNLRLVLDGSLEAALKFAVPEGKSRFVLATFGNLGVKDQLANFVQYCGRAGAAAVRPCTATPRARR